MILAIFGIIRHPPSLSLQLSSESGVGRFHAFAALHDFHARYFARTLMAKSQSQEMMHYAPMLNDTPPRYFLEAPYTITYKPMLAAPRRALIY